MNVLVDDNEVARIADFGLAVYIHGHSKNYASLHSGNVQWFAPELLRPPGRLTARPTTAADVYSFSHVCIEVRPFYPCTSPRRALTSPQLYTSGSPYPDLSEDNEIALGSFIDQVTDPVHPMRPSRPVDMLDELWALVQRC